MIISDANILNCDESLSSAWDQYLKTTPTSSFYHLYGWNRINKAHFSHQVYNLAAVDNNNIIGVFPLVFIKSRLFGNILCSMPFVNYGGPCANNSSIEKDLINAAINISKDKNIDYLEIRSKKIFDKALPTTKQKVSMSLELNNDSNILLQNFSRKHRKNIRRAYKENISVRSGTLELLDDFYLVLSDSWRNLGTPIYKKEYFETIINEFSINTKIFVCYLDNKFPIATALNGYYKDTVEGMWLGTISRHKNIYSNYVLYWEMIKNACENNFKFFHLGRSSIESGSEQFKKKWNATQKQLYWQYYLNNQSNLPELNVTNPKYKLAIKTWRKLPIKLTTLFGPVLARNIP